jgi:LuxR family quorum-sensing system transcriptional regulator SolR
MQDGGWWVDLFAGFEAASRKEQLTTQMGEAAAKLGFTYWAYGAKPAEPSRPADVRYENAYPAGWSDHYQRQRYLAFDPTVSIATQRSAAVTWSEAKRHGSRQLWADASDFGLNIGIAQPVWNRTGSFGLLTLAREKTQISPRELSAIGPHLTWLASMFHARFSNLTLSEREDFQLSSREIEILRWSAIGKTATEVAIIIGITTRTVNYHVANILSKMNVQNKIQATVRATTLGLL